MHWTTLGLCSALALGLYDVAKKHALRDNAVLPVLLGTVICGALAASIPAVLAHCWPGLVAGSWLEYPPLPPGAVWHALAKAILVASSWICAYFALKHLPISMAAPIRAAGPLLVILGATLLFAEVPRPLQGLGIAVLIGGYGIFNRLGRHDGITMMRSGWIWLMILATALGSLSSLYDRWLIGDHGCHPISLQIAFAWWLVPVLGLVVAVVWWPGRRHHTLPQWRWSIAAVGLLLIAADLVYFHAVADEAALIGVLSALRRSSVAVSLAVGGLVFREQRTGTKFLALMAVLAGVTLIIIG